MRRRPRVMPSYSHRTLEVRKKINEINNLNKRIKEMQSVIDMLVDCVNLIAHNGYEDGEIIVDIIPEQEAQNCLNDPIVKNYCEPRGD